MRLGLRGGIDEAGTVRFDFLDPSTFEAALRGVDRVFLLRPPQLARARHDFGPFIAAMLSEALGRWVIYRNPGIPAFLRHIRAAGYPLAFGLVMTGVYTAVRLGLAAEVIPDLGGAYRATTDLIAILHRRLCQCLADNVFGRTIGLRRLCLLRHSSELTKELWGAEFVSRVVVEHPYYTRADNRAASQRSLRTTHAFVRRAAYDWDSGPQNSAGAVDVGLIDDLRCGWHGDESLGKLSFSVA